MTTKRKVVEVSSAGRALAEPQFLIECDGKLYLTVAVREYDPNHPGIRDKQTQDIKKLQAMLRDGTATGKAVRFSPGGSAGAPKRTAVLGFASTDVGIGDTFAATDPAG